MKEPEDKPITIVTPPDLFFSTETKILLFGPGENWKETCVNFFYQNWNNSLCLYYTDEEEKNLEWLFSAYNLADFVICFLDDNTNWFYAYFSGLISNDKNVFTVVTFNEENSGFLNQFTKNNISKSLNDTLISFLDK